MLPKEIEHYIFVKKMIDRYKDVGSLFSLEFRIKDGIKDMLKDGFDEDNIKLVLSAIIEDQLEIADRELEEEAKKDEHETK